MAILKWGGPFGPAADAGPNRARPTSKLCRGQPIRPADEDGPAVVGSRRHVDTIGHDTFVERRSGAHRNAVPKNRPGDASGPLGRDAPATHPITQPAVPTPGLGGRPLVA